MMFRSLFAIAALAGCSAAQPEVHSVSGSPSPASPACAPSSTAAPITASVLHVGFTVSDLDRAAHAFARLDFKPGARHEFAGEAYETLLRLPGARRSRPAIPSAAWARIATLWGFQSAGPA